MTVSMWAASPAPIGSLWRPLAAATAISLLILALGFAASRGRAVGAVLAAGILLCFALQWLPGGVTLGILAWWAAVNWMRQRGGRPGLGDFPARAVAPWLNLGSLAFLGAALVSAAMAIAPVEVLPPRYAFHVADPKPNIYLVLLDGYPRADTLADAFGIDNQPFLEDLRRRGFVVGTEARSNYTLTSLTLAAMFDGAYVDQLGVRPTGSATGDLRALTTAINGSSMVDAFRGNGYSIITSASPFSDATLASADLVLDGGQATELELFMLQHTMLPGILDIVGSELLGDDQRARITGNLADLAGMPARAPGRPKLAFVHVVSPHPPFLWDDEAPVPLPSCFPRSCVLWEAGAEQRGLTHDQYGRAMRGQLTHLNRQVLATVDELEATDPTAVIVLFSDHGARSEGPPSDEYFRTFFAARTPGRGGVFPEDVSATNILRHLAGAYGDAPIAPLPYRAWLAEPGSLLRLQPYGE
jgi:hypothetical protein